jgi:hypothetical protein
MIKRRLGYILAIAILLIFITGIYYFYFWSPAPEWDKSPQTHIITIGKLWSEIDYSYIPDVQIWGDGYIVWVEYSSDETRKVLEGRLTQQEMTSLIQKLIGLDFFKIYRNGKDYEDFADVFITANLIGGSRSDGLDPKNKQLYDFAIYLKKGAGTIGTELIPTVGTFLAMPIEKEKPWLPANTKAHYHWPDDKFGYSLDTLEDDEKEIIGDELKFAWEVVNSPLPTVESQGKVYWVAVMLPKVSR